MSNDTNFKLWKKKELLDFCLKHNIRGCSLHNTKLELHALIIKKIAEQKYATKNCFDRKGKTGWGRDELLSMSRDIGLNISKNSSKAVICSHISRFFEKQKFAEIQNLQPAGASDKTNITVKELRELCKKKKIKGYTKMTKKELITACWIDRKKTISAVEKYKISLGEPISELNESLQNNANDMASALAGMLWILRKYRNKVCVAIKPSSLRSPKFGNDFCDFCLCWYANLQTLKWTFVKNENAFWNIITDWCDTQYVIVPVYIIAQENGEQYRHYNFIIIDRLQKQMERFEPYGIYDNSIVATLFKETELDDLLNKSCNKYGFNFLSAASYCPRIGIQTREEIQEQFAMSGDPVGFCSFWSLWYADRRLRYPDISPKTLVENLTTKVEKKDNIKKFIRTFAHFIDIEKRRIIQRAKDYKATNQWSDSRAVTEAILWEIMYSAQLKQLQ